MVHIYFCFFSSVFYWFEGRMRYLNSGIFLLQEVECFTAKPIPWLKLEVRKCCTLHAWSGKCFQAVHTDLCTHYAYALILLSYQWDVSKLPIFWLSHLERFVCCTHSVQYYVVRSITSTYLHIYDLYNTALCTYITCGIIYMFTIIAGKQLRGIFCHCIALGSIKPMDYIAAITFTWHHREC